MNLCITERRRNMTRLSAIGSKWALPADQRQLLGDLQAQLDNKQLDPSQVWREVCQQLLRPEQPFELHQELYAAVYSSWSQDAAGAGQQSVSSSSMRPPPVWLPDPQHMLATNVARFMASFQGDLAWEVGRTGDPAADWDLLHRVSCDNPDVFWGAVFNKALGVNFATPPSRILRDNVQHPDKATWLPGARLNIAACALHSPLCPGPDAPAVVWAAEGRPTQLHHISWSELRQRVMQAAVSIAATFQPGDAVAIAMPMTAESVVVYLAIILAGCVAVSIADSFSAQEVSTRLRLSGAKALVTQDVIPRGGKVLPLYSRMLEAPNLPTTIVIPAAAATAAAAAASVAGQQQLPGVKLRHGDVWWQDFLIKGSSTTSSRATQASSRPLPHIVAASAPCNILFSSGTTGEPKAIPWSHTTPLRCAVDGWAQQDIHPGHVVAWPTNLGWMMGPWLLYASLLNGATIALYQGAPLGRDFGEFVAAAHVNVLGLVPSIVKAWRSSNCMAHLDWSSITCFSSTGEASSPDDYHWLSSRVTGYRPVIEYCGGTEIGGGFLSGCLLQPQAPSTFSTPTLGARLAVLTDAGQIVLPDKTCTGAIGELSLVPPMLGSSQRLLLRDHTATYYEGMPCSTLTGGPLRRHGDEIQVLPGGYYRALGRCDDTMNLGGIKVSSVELERTVMQQVLGVSEVAAVGVPTPGGGPELLHLFVVPSQAKNMSPDQVQALQQACQAAIKAHLNPLFKVHKLLLAGQLPRTASNKVMRRLLRDQVQQPHGRL